MQVESRFFDVASGLEPGIVKILNSKLTQIRDFFTTQMQLICHTADNLRQKVDLLERENKSGIKFKDLDTEKLI